MKKEKQIVKRDTKVWIKMKCNVSNGKGYIEIYLEDIERGVRKFLEVLYTKEELKEMENKSLFKFEKKWRKCLD